MKNLYLLFILFFSTASIYAQEFHQRNASTSSREIKRLDRYEYYSWDVNSGDWEKKYMYDYLYNDKFQLVKTDNYNSDLSNTSSKDIYYYDSNGNLTEHIEESKNQTIGEEYIYDGKVLKNYKGYRADPVTKSKSYYKNLNYTYFENGLVKEEIEYDIEENKILSKEEYLYDERGNKIEILKYSRNIDTDVLRVISKSEFTYDSHNNSTSYTLYVLDPATEKLDTKPKNRSLHEYHYNNDDLLEKELFLLWHKDNNTWETNSGKKYKYDIFGNLTETIHFNGDEINPSIKIEYDFFDSSDKEDMVLPSPDYFYKEYLFAYNNIPSSRIRYIWNSKSGSWEPTSMNIYKYSTQEITSLVSSQTGSIIYPNPATEYVNIRIPEGKDQVSFELFDPQGKKIMEKYVRNQGSVHLTELNSGIYFYTLTAENYYHKGKIVKK